MASFPPHRRQPSSLRTILIAGVVFLGVNLIAALAYRSYRKGQPAEPTPPAAEATVGARPAREDMALLRAHRALAVDAIETGDYDAAVKTLTEIVRSGRGVGDEPELLRIAKDLQEKHAQKSDSPAVALREKAAVEPAPPPPPPEKEKKPEPVAEKEKEPARKPEPAKKPEPKHAKPSKPPAREERKVASAKPVPVIPDREPDNGQVLVMSVPSALSAEVDGQPAGNTPTRYSTTPGAHTVTLFKGNQKVAERTVMVSENSVATVDFDVRDQLQPPPSVAMKELEKKDAALAPDPEKEKAEAEKLARTEPAPAATTPASAAAGTGEVMVPPVSLAGNVYINGRSYGPPPVLARDIPAGTATVELRVGDAVKRSKVVAVEARQRATVKFR
ncbi:MAG TPA: PEGA domain-containing protein [Myxococcales bacterium]|nr:PEGA domain-containing protein [Myxococcales bacterium]